MHSERGPSSSTPLRADLLERVRFVDDADTALAGADVLVAASDGVAPAPGLIARAQAAGAVPVASRLAVYEEVLGDGEAGLLFEPNDLETLTAQLGRLVVDGDLRERLRAAARPRPWSVVADELEALYGTLAARRHGVRGNAEIARRLQSRRTIDVDLHMHTDHSHDCATPVEVLLATARAQGLGAIAVTDHNEVSGALEAAAKAADYGVKVIVGEEVKTAHQGEVIGLFLKEKIPRGLTLEETVAEIRRQGGVVYVPHPFDRMHAVPDYEHLLDVVEDVDAIEVYNPRVAIGSFNEEAARFAAKYRILGRRRLGRPRHPGAGLGARAHARLRRAGRVPRGAARGRDHHQAVEPALRAGAEVPRDEGDSAGRARAPARAPRAPRDPQAVMQAQGRPADPSKPAGPMPATDDEIREKYLERAIRELNSLTRELQSCQHCPRGNLMPVLGSGHPQADVFLLKFAPAASEVEEGVAFYGRSGTALMKSLKRLGIDPLAVYGTLCVKCPVSDPSLADPACIARVLEELAIVAPKIVVVMGEDALAALNDLDVPLARPIDPDLGVVQAFTPSCEALVVPNIDEALDEEAAKREFWSAFRVLGEWYEDLPPY